MKRGFLNTNHGKPQRRKSGTSTSTSTSTVAESTCMKEQEQDTTKEVNVNVNGKFATRTKAVTATVTVNGNHCNNKNRRDEKLRMKRGFLLPNNQGKGPKKSQADGKVNVNVNVLGADVDVGVDLKADRNMTTIGNCNNSNVNASVQSRNEQKYENREKEGRTHSMKSKSQSISASISASPSSTSRNSSTSFGSSWKKGFLEKKKKKENRKKKDTNTHSKNAGRGTCAGIQVQAGTGICIDEKEEVQTKRTMQPANTKTAPKQKLTFLPQVSHSHSHSRPAPNKVTTTTHTATAPTNPKPASESSMPITSDMSLLSLEEKDNTSQRGSTSTCTRSDENRHMKILDDLGLGLGLGLQPSSSPSSLPSSSSPLLIHAMMGEDIDVAKADTTKEIERKGGRRRRAATETSSTRIRPPKPLVSILHETKSDKVDVNDDVDADVDVDVDVDVDKHVDVNMNLSESVLATDMNAKHKQNESELELESFSTRRDEIGNNEINANANSNSNLLFHLNHPRSLSQSHSQSHSQPHLQKDDTLPLLTELSTTYINVHKNDDGDRDRDKDNGFIGLGSMSAVSRTRKNGDGDGDGKDHNNGNPRDQGIKERVGSKLALGEHSRVWKNTGTNTNINTSNPKLQTDLSLLLSSMERQRHRYRHRHRRRRHNRRKRRKEENYTNENTDEDEDEAGNESSNNTALVEHFLSTYIETKSGGTKKEDVDVDVNANISSANANANANLAFIWDSILESIAPYAKECDIFSIERNKGTRTGSGSSSTMMIPAVLELGYSVAMCRSEESVEILLGYCENNDNDGGDRDDDNGTDAHVHTHGHGHGAPTSSKRKRARVQTLGAIVTLKFLICSWYADATGKLCQYEGGGGRHVNVHDVGYRIKYDVLSRSLIRGLPLLYRIICGGSGGGSGSEIVCTPLHTSIHSISNVNGKDKKRRTILSSTAMDTVCCWLEYTSFLYQMKTKMRISPQDVGIKDDAVTNNVKTSLSHNLYREELQMFLWQSIPIIDDIVTIQMSWKVGVKNGTTNDARSEGSVSKTVKKDHCSSALLNDWKRIFSYVRERFSVLKFKEMVDELDAQSIAIQLLTKELAGMHLKHNQASADQRDDERYLHYGGFGQTLCKQRSVLSNEWEKQLLTGLNLAIHFVSTEHEEKAIDRDTNKYTNEGVTIMQTVCAQLAMKKKKLQRQSVIGEEESFATKAVELCMLLLKSKSTRFLDLVLAVLNELWSSSGDVPHDFELLDRIPNGSEFSRDFLPNSFKCLMKEMEGFDVKEDELDPSQRVMCIVFERFLVYRPEVLLPYFLSHIQFRPCEVYVLVSILDNADDKVSYDTMCEVEEALFGVFAVNTFLQKLACSKEPLFASLPIHKAVPHLLKILRGAESSSFLSYAASTILTRSIEKNAMAKGDEIVGYIVDIAKNENGVTNDQKSLRKSNCLKYASNWRNALLSHESCEDEAYCRFLLACGRSMFNDPADSVALEVFGAVLGRWSGEDETSLRRRRIKISTIALVQLGITEMRKIDKQNASAETNYFERLSPLLMLRRIPFQYYRICQDEADEIRPFETLALILAEKFGMETGKQAILQGEQVLTTEERKLLADIAARCLAFSNLKGEGEMTVFNLFCRPIFSTSLASLDDGWISYIDWRALKIALYVGCHVVQIAPETISKEDYQFMAFASFKIILIDIQGDMDEECMQNVADVQTGSINFLAACICSKFSFQSPVPNLEQGGVLIKEICDTKCRKGHSDGTISQQHLERGGSFFLANLRNEMLLLFQGVGKQAESCSLESKSITFVPNGEWAWPSRVCIMNAFLLACQKCDVDMIQDLATAIIPDVLRWLQNGNIGEGTRHIMCVASALQCLFTLLQRTKNFRCLHSCCHSSIQLTVRAIFQIAVNAISYSPRNNTDHYHENTMRLAALKLLMAIVSIDQSPSPTFHENTSTTKDSEHIPPGELLRVISILRGIENLDQSEEVRKLATHLLHFLRS